jgi:hypothetical protein
MAEKKKTILDEVEAIESAVAAELTESQNLVRPKKTAKAAADENTTEAEKTVKAEKTTKTKKTVKAEKAPEEEQTDKTTVTSQAKKTTKTKKTADAEKTVATKSTTRTATKTAKTKTAKPPENAEPVKPVEEDITEAVYVPDAVVEVIDTDDIIEYIQPSSLEALKARYGEAEEDEQIRNEGFELAKKSRLNRRPKPEEASFEYYATPASRDDIRTDVDSSLSDAFDSTRSEFDADTVSFEDIATVSKPVPTVTPPVSPEAVRATGNRYGYDTHTTVIYYDESADDGIRRNSETELTSAFVSDSDKPKRRKFPWSRKKK